MKTQETNEIRELTAAELEVVSGGLFWSWLIGPAVGAAGLLVGGGLMALGMSQLKHDD